MSGPGKPGERRGDYPHFRDVPTRWMANDAYGHVNNVVYYSFFDTVVNGYLIEAGALDIAASPAIGLVIETRCTYYQELTYPETVEAGLRVEKLGNSSVTYRIGLFKRGSDEPAATGHFVHVYVDRETRRPVRVPDDTRAALAPLLAKF
ncbi:MAG: thioesterase family protein [Bauldia litoralis]